MNDSIRKQVLSGIIWAFICLGCYYAGVNAGGPVAVQLVNVYPHGFCRTPLPHTK